MNDFESALTVVNARAELARAAAWVAEFAERASLPPDIASRLQVVLDETLSNVFVHAFAGAPDGTRQAVLGLRRRAGRVELELTDDGPAFDPTRAPAANAEARLAQRQPGGVGLLFVKVLTDEMHFTRRGDHNRVIMALHLPQPDQGADDLMEILEAASDGATVLHVAGRVNSANAPELGARLQGLLAKGCRSIIVDLSHLVHMTSAGFRSLLRADKQAGEAGGMLVLCGLHGLTLELFEIGGFLEMFTVAASRDEAVRRVRFATKA